jgi:pre-mRNA-processing factor SLU7
MLLFMMAIVWEKTDAERRSRKQAELDEKFKEDHDPVKKAERKAARKVARDAERAKTKGRKRKFDTGEGAGGGDGDDSKESDTDTDTDDSSEGSDNEKDHTGKVMQKFDVKNRVTVRNLRIREDTAKYLRNLRYVSFVPTPSL